MAVTDPDHPLYVPEENRRVAQERAKEYVAKIADYLEVYDFEHSLDEDRYIAIGPIKRGLICVVHVERAEDRIRLISARFATSRERGLFAEFMEGRSP